MTPRLAIAVCVFVGATAVPLALEVVWRSNGDPGSHFQPEVATIEKGGQTVAKGKDPYHDVTNSHGKVLYRVPGEPTYEGFLPYLPLMTVFGLPSARHHDIVLTDARIFFSLATLALTAVALWLCPADGRRKMRTLQVIAILPTAALPLATGGDDMPIVAFLLLAMVLAQRRQPFASGVVLGVVSAMKFTAWPLAALALFAARDRRGVRRPGHDVPRHVGHRRPGGGPLRACAARGPSSTMSCCSRSACRGSPHRRPARSRATSW